MAYSTAFNAYKETGVKTAGQGQLVVMLYDEAIKQLKSALGRIENDEGKIPAHLIEPFGASILKAESIITELQASLNMEEGGEISKNLLALYIYFNQELNEANISHDKTKIELVLKLLGDLREAWSSIAQTAGSAQTASYDAPAIDIDG
ncbi:MAG: hypothetical protein Ta2A_25740 [Treponemataceae bacterium]|nr:MAG: hypothetical protein Ta2A_25740 [Treponemataceae bacterium]